VRANIVANNQKYRSINRIYGHCLIKLKCTVAKVLMQIYVDRWNNCSWNITVAPATETARSVLVSSVPFRWGEVRWGEVKWSEVSSDQTLSAWSVRSDQVYYTFICRFSPCYIGTGKVRSLWSVRTKLIHLISLWVGPRELQVFMSGQIDRLPVSLPQVRSF